MKLLENAPQGSPQWHAARATHFCASEAAAAMGVSKYTTRSALLRQKSTGIAEEVTPAKQRLFNAGHMAEAKTGPIAERIAGVEFFPAVGLLDFEGLPLLASFDGIDIMEAINWENKLLNADLAEQVRRNELEPHYWAQLEHQLLVSGAEKALFTTSDGTESGTVHCWYQSIPERRAQLIAAWHQFAIDLAAYVPPEVIVPAVAAPQIGLPAVSIQVNGSIALVDNLDKFGAALTAYVERINKEPQSDQDFADLESTVKTLKAAEEALDAAENGALAQTASIDTMRRTVALYRDTARTNRLLVEKLVKVEKENRRIKIVGDAVAELVSHVKALNVRLGKLYMPTIAGDFQGVVKGLKSLDSMRDKVAGELARCKIEANEIADRIQANLATLGAKPDMAFLFPDVATLVLKQPDDMTATVTARITQHEAAEAAKLEAERTRIRAEEQARAEREHAAKVESERIQREQIEQAQATRIREEQVSELTLATAPPCHQTVVPVPVTHETVVQIMMPATVRQAMAPKPATPPTLALGVISERLGFNVTSAFLASLGFEATTVKAAKLFQESDFFPICMAIIDHIESVSELQAA